MCAHLPKARRAARKSTLQLKDERQKGLLKQAWRESGGVSGYHDLTLDMRDLGKRCGKHRLAGLLKTERLRLETGL